MIEYEVVREIQNLCPNNQMRDVFFEEIETDDPVEYVREKTKGTIVEISKVEDESGNVTVFVNTDGMIQKYVFTRI